MLQLIINDHIVDIVGDGANHKAIRFKAHSGDKIVIQDDKVKHSPLKLKTKKVDDDLYIFEENTQDPSVIIEDYFSNDNIVIYAYEANGTLEPYIYAEASDHIEGLLYLSSEPAALLPATGLIGALALGGIVAAAGGGGGGSGGDGDTTPPTTNSTINSYVDDVGTITSTTSTAITTDDATVTLNGTNSTTSWRSYKCLP